MVTTKKLDGKARGELVERLERGELRPQELGKEIGKMIGRADQNEVASVIRGFLEKKYHMDPSGYSKDIDINNIPHDGLTFGVYGPLAFAYVGEVSVKVVLYDKRTALTGKWHPPDEPLNRAYPVFTVITESGMAARMSLGINTFDAASEAGGGATAIVIGENPNKKMSIEIEVVLPIKVVKERLFSRTDLNPQSAANLLIKVAQQPAERDRRRFGSLSLSEFASQTGMSIFTTFEMSKDGKNVIVYSSWRNMIVDVYRAEAQAGIRGQVIKATLSNPIRNADGSPKQLNQELGISMAVALLAHEICALGERAAFKHGGTYGFELRE